METSQVFPNAAFQLGKLLVPGYMAQGLTLSKIEKVCLWTTPLRINKNVHSGVRLAATLTRYTGWIHSTQSSIATSMDWPGFEESPKECLSMRIGIGFCKNRQHWNLRNEVEMAGG